MKTNYLFGLLFLFWGCIPNTYTDANDSEEYHSYGPNYKNKELNLSMFMEKTDSLVAGDTVLIYTTMYESFNPKEFTYRWQFIFGSNNYSEYYHDLNLVDIDPSLIGHFSNYCTYESEGADSIRWIVPDRNGFHLFLELRTNKIIDSTYYFRIRNMRLDNVNEKYSTTIENIFGTWQASSDSSFTYVELDATLQRDYTNYSHQYMFWKPFVVSSEGDTSYSLNVTEPTTYDSLSGFYTSTDYSSCVIKELKLNANQQLHATLISYTNVFNNIPDTLTSVIERY